MSEEPQRALQVLLSGIAAARACAGHRFAVHYGTMQAREQRSVAAPPLEQRVNELRGRGRPLPEPARQALERSSGRLLGHVRIHDDALGSSLAEAVSARAVTIGGDLAVGPSGAGSLGVLAHELAHAARLSGTPAHGPVALSSAGDAVEQAVGSGARN